MNEYIIVTGADGNIGGKLTKLLVDSIGVGVIAVSSFPDRIPAMIEREQVISTGKVIQISSENFFSTDFSEMHVVGAVHLAFSRAIFPNKDIASSLDYSLKAFTKIVDEKINNAIYVSTQGVYGDTNDWRTIETPPAPNTIYSMAKYAGEKLFEAVYSGHEELQHTILRLDNVIQSQNLVKTLCKNAKETGELNLKGGKQVFSYIDMEDVPRAINAMLQCRKPWRAIYNVGPNRERHTLIDIAEMVKQVALEKGREVAINLIEDDSELWAGMDSMMFIRDTKWNISKEIQESIRSIYNEGVICHA